MNDELRSCYLPRESCSGAAPLTERGLGMSDVMGPTRGALVRSPHSHVESVAAS